MYTRESGIYLLTNTANGKLYVGSTVDLRVRPRQHFSELRRQKHVNPHLRSAWVYYGSGAFIIETLEHCAVEDLIEREMWWTELLDTMNPDKGYNLAYPDRHTVTQAVREKLSAANRGKTLSPEHRSRIGAAHKGLKQSPEVLARLSIVRRGRKLSPEHCEALLASLRGRPVSEETRAKISVANKGRTHSPEAKEKMSAAKAGKPRGPLSPETRAKISAANMGNQNCKGRTLSPEAKARISKANMGYKPTEETRAKMSAAQKGKSRGPCSPEHRAKISAAKKGQPRRHKLAPEEDQADANGIIICDRGVKLKSLLHLWHWIQQGVAQGGHMTIPLLEGAAITDQQGKDLTHLAELHLLDVQLQLVGKTWEVIFQALPPDRVTQVTSNGNRPGSSVPGEGKAMPGSLYIRIDELLRQLLVETDAILGGADDRARRPSIAWEINRRIGTTGQQVMDRHAILVKDLEESP